MEPLKIPLDLLELIVDLLNQLKCFIFLIFSLSWVECVFFTWKSSESKSHRTVRAWTSVGITDLLLLDWVSGSTCNAVGMPSLVPEIEFLGVECSEIEIVLESLVDYVCFADMVKSLKSLISSCDAAYSWLFPWKSMLQEELLVEISVSLRSTVSEMLTKSIWDWFTTSVSRNSRNGKSSDGTGSGTGSETEVEILCWISTPLSEM